MSIWKTKWGYRAEFMLNGERIRAQGFFKYKDEARQWVKDEKERVKENQKRYSSQDRDLGVWSLAQKYLADCKINFGIKTFDEKRYCLERFYKFVGDVSVIDISPPMILEFINERAKSKSANSANKDRKNIKAFYSWIQQIYGVMHDPTAPIKMKRHEKQVRRLIPIQDILKVLLIAQGHDRVLIGAYWHTGARKSEIFRWTWVDDINFEERWVRLGTQKSRTGEMVYEKLWMNDDLQKLLLWQWTNRHPTSPFVFCHMDPKSKLYGKPFVSRRKLLKSLCENAGVEPFGYHDIRHSVAKYLNDLQKVGLKKVQQVLRHRRQSTTEIYVEGNYTTTQEAISLLELANVQKCI
ncbi:tyrosine-type recombinase/integrase [Desulfatitalea tepidiphila]|uniref:tyrosine-type recombinase/integrase n=1 Tax=Desulfatitalea tepidiphila TaxID=1185843 RepID=UPI0006B440B3|nr:tyrosine-type recombinase/integrase [Desulfatitalea tepidiphila]